jgi:hypothetical protein
VEDSELIALMKADKERGSGTKKFWNLDKNFEGTKTIRFLPALSKFGEKFFYMSHKTHWIDGKAFECLDQNTKDHQAEACPVCKVVQKLYKTAEKGTPDWELAGSLRARDRKVSRIVVRGSEDETAAVFYEYGTTIFDMLFNIITESDFGNITNPTTGRDYKLTRTGQGRNVKYSSSTPSAKESPIFTEKEKMVALLKNMETLDYNSLVEYSSAQEMTDALNEFLNGGDEEAEVVQVHQPVAAKPSPAKQPVKQEQTASVEEDDADLDDILSSFNL